MINIEKDDVVYHNKKHYYHFQCLVKKQLNKKTNKLSEEQIEKNIREIQSKSQCAVNDIIFKNRLYSWIQNNYNVVVLPKYFFIKMDSIYSGTYKGLSCGIPAEHILDMWKRKKTELDKIALNNTTKGKEINGLSRVQYDLAIIINKYDSYLNWIEKQKILEHEKNKIIEEKTNKINYNNINRKIDTQNTNIENDINSILDEVF
jgi:hypothetical protein